jgi:hypothetical protein
VAKEHAGSVDRAGGSRLARTSSTDGRPAAEEPSTLLALSELDRYKVDPQGYLLFEGVLDPGTVGRLRSVMDAQGLPPADETIERQRFGGRGQLSPGIEAS